MFCGDRGNKILAKLWNAQQHLIITIVTCSKQYSYCKWCHKTLLNSVFTFTIDGSSPCCISVGHCLTSFSLFSNNICLLIVANSHIPTIKNNPSHNLYCCTSMTLYTGIVCVSPVYHNVAITTNQLFRVFFLQQEAITWYINREELWQVDYIKNMFEIPFLVCTPQMCIYVHTKSESEIWTRHQRRWMWRCTLNESQYLMCLRAMTVEYVHQHWCHNISIHK